MSLETLANFAQILTAIVAAGAAAYYGWDRRQKRLRLEEYLKAERQSPEPEHTVLHLMAALGMTEAELLHAGFRSAHVECLVHADPKTGLADKLLFAYKD
jgi:hypothetical protein